MSYSSYMTFHLTCLIHLTFLSCVTCLVQLTSLTHLIWLIYLTCLIHLTFLTCVTCLIQLICLTCLIKLTCLTCQNLKLWLSVMLTGVEAAQSKSGELRSRAKRKTRPSILLQVCFEFSRKHNVVIINAYHFISKLDW